MQASPFETTQLDDYIQRIHSGDPQAIDELLRHTCDRLQRLAHKMIRSYPALRSYVETDDLMQNSLLRLWRVLKKVQPQSTRHFFNLAAEQMRWELLDLARHYCGRGQTVLPLGPHRSGGSEGEANAVTEAPDDAPEVEKWCAFHERVASLPTAEREVVGLIFYHGWKQAQVAQLLQTTERTVRRRWTSAMLKIKEAMDT